jgi:LysR family carnitine catabolism transcriptional activator
LTDQLVGIFPDEDPVLDAAALTWRLIADRPYIAIARQSSVHQLVDQALQIAKVSLRPVYEVLYVATAINLVKSRMGFAIMRELALEPVNLDGLAKRPIVDPPAYRTVGILTHRRKSLTPAASVAANALLDAAERRQPRSAHGD